ncbi:4-alpha-glucanotransferase [Streptomyces sp. H27-D2]|uniref:4-alpha-glucanotransferase n=1 Tax=Streptomyces sp. H27-D2 TaxID=3046304 RepID=UPI002DBE84EA|nr:4-alpha-glucanotransferase [Streptomyces sp. H27-D2]MEC4014892.1 4-alpha-glucanotransferase [Streptomyces sp. H27-D2]
MGRTRLAALHGVATSYEPGPGRTVQVPDETLVAVLAALGVDASTPRAVRAALDRHAHRERLRLLPATVVLRAGRLSGPAPLPDLPEGTALRVETDTGESLDWGFDPAEYGRPPGPGSADERPAALGADGRPAASGRSTASGTGPAASATRPAVSRTGPPASGTRPAAFRAGPGRQGAPRPLPLGCHTLRAHAPDGRSARASLIVAPDRVPEPPGRQYGFMVQLYSLLSARSWGMGDLGDLAELAAWSGRSLGAGFVQVNPLHAAVPGAPTDPSPYRPSSRRFPDPVYLRIEDIPEYAHLEPADRRRAEDLLTRAAALRHAVLHEDGLIDRDAVWALKREALELLRAVPLSPGRRAAYCDFLAEQGQPLDDHATWCALAERHGSDWHSWPAGLRDPRSSRTARARGESLDRVDFHCWLAWLTDAQLGAAQRAARDAGMGIGVVHDLAVGVHPCGADVWAQQDAFATGMSIGAPPDAFNSRGQDWGLPPWRPDALAATGYAPYRDLLRGVLRHAGALRIDHVMGLFRLWWVPEGRDPTEGCYVRYDAEAMLGVLALEAHRAGAVVIGEDLGTVEPGVREALAGRGILGTSVMWFERDYRSEAAVAPGASAGLALSALADPALADPALADPALADPALADPAPAACEAAARDSGARSEAAELAGRPRPLPPEAWRADCLATVTTHDLPSTAARLTGEHVGLRHRLGLLSRPLAEEQAAEAVEVAEWLALLGRLGLLPEGTCDEEAAIKAVHRFLTRTPARMLGVWLPDAVGDRRPQNLPGTWDQYPNWRLPIADATGRPVGLEELAASPRLHALMDVLRPLRDLAGSGPAVSESESAFASESESAEA